METARTLHPEEEVEASPKRSVEELLATVGEEKAEPSEDVQVSLRNLTTSSPPTILGSRPVTQGDLEALQENLPSIVFAGDISPGIIRSSHHAMARDLANGHKLVDVSRLYGLPVTTLKSLMDAPAFIDLMVEYKGVETLEFSMENKLESLAHDGLDEIRTRLEIQPEKFSTGQLIQMSGDMLDRAGYGKVTKHMQLTGVLGGTDLKRIKETEPQLEGGKTSPTEGQRAEKN